MNQRELKEKSISKAYKAKNLLSALRYHSDKGNEINVKIYKIVIRCREIFVTHTEISNALLLQRFTQTAAPAHDTVFSL